MRGRVYFAALCLGLVLIAFGYALGNIVGCHAKDRRISQLTAQLEAANFDASLALRQADEAQAAIGRAQGVGVRIFESKLRDRADCRELLDHCTLTTGGRVLAARDAR